MESFLIEGPSRLEGTITASGAKNAALPALAACLLANRPVQLTGMPLVRDVLTMGKVLEHLGATVEHTKALSTDPLTPTPPRSNIHCGAIEPSREAPYELVKTMRASVLVLGPLVARFGRARVSLPGGCAIGARPIDQHLAGLEAMGATVTLEHGYVTVYTGPGQDRLRACRFRFAMPSVTGTENLMMAATLARGTTILDNCAREPEIENLADLLTSMGAQIRGAGADTIEIQGVDSLNGAHHRIIGDRIEAGTYLIGGVMTGGHVTVRGVSHQLLRPLLEKLTDCGAVIEYGTKSDRITSDSPGDRVTITAAAGENLIARDLVTAPHPGFPTDLQAQFLALMTQAEGTATVVESVFENRFQHVPELRRMGADVSVQGNTARITGPAKLTGTTVMATDLRASACLVLAGITASGTTQVDRIYHLDRGYEEMESKLQALGARVRRVS